MTVVSAPNSSVKSSPYGEQILRVLPTNPKDVVIYVSSPLIVVGDGPTWYMVVGTNCTHPGGTVMANTGIIKAVTMQKIFMPKLLFSRTLVLLTADYTLTALEIFLAGFHDTGVLLYFILAFSYLFLHRVLLVCKTLEITLFGVDNE